MFPMPFFLGQPLPGSRITDDQRPDDQKPDDQRSIDKREQTIGLTSDCHTFGCGFYVTNYGNTEASCRMISPEKPLTFLMQTSGNLGDIFSAIYHSIWEMKTPRN
jgi:hypothetical protein